MGPCRRLYIRDAWDEHQCHAVVHWLEQHSQQVQNSRNALDTRPYASWDFWVADGGPLEVAYAGPGCPFLLSIKHPCYQPDALPDQERKQLRRYLGSLPQQQWDPCAMGNDPLDWELWRALTLRLAEDFNGVIRLDAMYPPVTLEEAQTRNSPARPSLEAQRAYAARFPGKVHEIAYDWGHGQVGTYFVGDADFFRAEQHSRRTGGAFPTAPQRN